MVEPGDRAVRLGGLAAAAGAAATSVAYRWLDRR